MDDEDGKYRSRMRFSAIENSLGIIKATVTLHHTPIERRNQNHCKTYISLIILYFALLPIMGGGSEPLDTKHGQYVLSYIVQEQASTPRLLAISK